MRAGETERGGGRSGVAGKAAAAALYAALTLVLAYPLSIHPDTSALPGDPDTDLFTWTLAWGTHAVVNRPLSIFDANIYHPQADTLAYSENLLGSVPFAAPVIWLTGNPVLALNAVALLSVVLCGLGAYVLARRLGLGTAAALLCGLVFAFSPARFFRIGQLHLTTVQWVPFGLASLHAYLDGGRGRDLKLAVCFFTLQALTSGHGAVFLAVAMAGLVAFRFATGDPVAPLRRARDLGVTGLLLLVPTVLVFLPYRRVQAEMGLRRSLENWAVTPASYVASPARLHEWVLSWLPDTGVLERASAFLFPGYLPLLLACAALVWGLGRGGTPAARRAVWFYGLLTLGAALLAIGPPLGLWPLVYWLPGFNFIRVPSRFVILAVLGLAVLAGFGFDFVRARLAPARRRGLALALGALMVGEFAAIPLPTRAYAVAIPAVDRWLDTRPKPFVVAEVPVDGSERLQSTYMLHSMAHWQKTVHGHSGIRPGLHVELYDRLRSFPDAASLDALDRFGVTYVVVHPEYYREGEWEAVQERLEAFGDRLALAHEADGGRVYRLRGR